MNRKQVYSEKMSEKIHNEISKYLKSIDKQLFKEDNIGTIRFEIEKIFNNPNVMVFISNYLWKHSGIKYDYELKIRMYFKDDSRTDFMYVYVAKSGAFLIYPSAFKLPIYKGD